MPGLANKLRVLFKPPGWRADNQATHCKLGKETVDLKARFDPQISTFSLYYTFAQFLFTVVLSLAVLLDAAALNYTLLSLAVSYLFFSFLALTLEIIRLVFLAPCLLLLGLNPIVTVLLIGNVIIALPLLLALGSKRIQLGALPS